MYSPIRIIVIFILRRVCKIHLRMTLKVKPLLEMRPLQIDLL